MDLDGQIQATDEIWKPPRPHKNNMLLEIFGKKTKPITVTWSRTFQDWSGGWSGMTSTWPRSKHPRSPFMKESLSPKLLISSWDAWWVIMGPRRVKWIGWATRILPKFHFGILPKRMGQKCEKCSSHFRWTILSRSAFFCLLVNANGKQIWDLNWHCFSIAFQFDDYFESLGLITWR